MFFHTVWWEVTQIIFLKFATHINESVSVHQWLLDKYITHNMQSTTYMNLMTKKSMFLQICDRNIQNIVTFSLSTKPAVQSMPSRTPVYKMMNTSTQNGDMPAHND